MMFRLLHVCVGAGLLACAAYAYSIKYETSFTADKLTVTKRNVQKEHDSIAVLRAEWQLLTTPERVQALAEKHLDVQPISVRQIVRFQDLPERKPKDDSIGRKLEDLGVFLSEEKAPVDKITTGALPPKTPPKR
jgi:hypothetical protein